MKLFKIIALAAAVGAAGACGSDQPDNGTNSANTAAGANQAAKSAPNSTAPDGPAATLRALSEASQKKDVEGIKRYLSRGTLERLEEGAKEENVSVDEVLRQENGAPFPTVPELGREEIAGDTATLEVRNVETKQFEKLPFVKEDGVWKVAIDQYIDNLEATMEEQEQEPPRAKP